MWSSMMSLPPVKAKARKPPPPTTPLTFPYYRLDDGSTQNGRSDLDLAKLLISVKSHTDLTALHLSALNLCISCDVSLDEIVPACHLPHQQWEIFSSSNTAGLSAVPSGFRLLANGRSAPGRSNFQLLLRELLLRNEEVFDTLESTLGQKSVQVAHYRRFFLELRGVADYWDSTVDEQVKTSVATDISLSTPSIGNLSTLDQSQSSEAKVVYTGRRTSTGDQMPRDYLGKVICEFIEPILWQFGCRYDTPRTQSLLPIQNIRVPVKFAGLVYRTPLQRPTSSIGTLEGPVMGLQARPETKFGADDKVPDMIDVLREVGAMLLMAQMRAREGTQEVIVGLDNWYVTRPRWGGGTGVAIAKPLGVGSEEEAATEGHSRSGVNAGKGEQSEEPPTKMRTEEKLARAAKNKENRKKEEIRRSTLPPSSKWDRRVNYMHIGKGANDKFDPIYMISSLNHHISIIRIFVHPGHLEYLARGGTEVGEPRIKLQMDRTRWYDLFSPADRKEALRGVWGVLSYLTGAH